ncbi:hypothetical protein CK203_009733 [Vitis vinifera]|uniref:Uncharacterized protein n=1 Tax=Vitis vinifera TaxID=29760 RepID=A0A438JV55_VITVI|nr:hypothetical protein CK203_009733 [Vitis vinifera]
MVASKVREGLRGGKCWFAVESKTFEISIEVGKLGVKKKLSLRCLKVWEDGGRKFRFSWGWFLLAKKLRALGVSTLTVSKVFPGVPIFEKVGCSFKEKVKRTYADAMRVKTGEPRESLWLHFGDRELLCKEEQLSHCLVGCFGDNSDLVPPPSSLKGWVIARWALRGEEGRGLKISKLGKALLLFEFENKFENGSHAKEVWVRIVGLPLHFWSREVFKRIRQSCGGFVAVDEETTLFSQLQWVHILVKTTRKDLPGSLAGREVRHDFVVGSHVGENVRESQPSVQKLRSEEQFKYGRRNRGVVGVAGRSAKGTVLDSDFLGLGSRKLAVWRKRERGFRLKASLETDVGATRMELVVLADEDFTPEGSLSSRPTITDEALMTKASRGGRDEGWNSSCLAKFSQCIGMPTRGFEEEILYLLRRMKGRIDQKGQDGVSRKTKSPYSNLSGNSRS